MIQNGFKQSAWCWTSLGRGYTSVKSWLGLEGDLPVQLLRAGRLVTDPNEPQGLDQVPDQLRIVVRLEGPGVKSLALDWRRDEAVAVVFFRHRYLGHERPVGGETFPGMGETGLRDSGREFPGLQRQQVAGSVRVRWKEKISTKVPEIFPEFCDVDANFLLEVVDVRLRDGALVAFLLMPEDALDQVVVLTSFLGALSK